jgi:tartrate-resistant acid phosphatase type 5
MPARYYTFAWGAAQFFMLDSDPNEPDGVSADSAQAAWLRAQLAASQARWKLVAFHHPPFSSGLHGPSAWMQWPFAAWGAHAVLGGHDHTYERIERDGALYFVNGLGGASRYAAGESPAAGSRIFYNASHGAMLVTLDERGCEFQFVAIGGEVIDRRALGGA